jgi:epoxyqueuosine reductase QueG
VNSRSRFRARAGSVCWRIATDSRETSPESSGAPLHPGTDAPPLVALLEMALDPEAWEAFSRGSAIRRAGRAGFARNVCVALGN